MSQKKIKQLRKAVRNSKEFKEALDELQKEKTRLIAQSRNELFAKGGLALEKSSHKDYIREKAFGGQGDDQSFEWGSRIRAIKNSPLTIDWIIQGAYNACVPATFTFLNRYNSWFNSKNHALLDWKYLFNNVPQYAEGTKPRTVADLLRKTGQPELAKDNPEKYKIKNYFYVLDRRYENIKHILKQTPMLVGVYANEAGLSKNKYGHALALVDLNENGDYICCNWWLGMEVVTVPKSVKLISAITVEDLPDFADASQVRLGVRGKIRQFL